MKRVACGIAVIALCGCGGGSGGGSMPAPTPAPPVVPAPPAITVVSGEVLRYAAAGSGVAIDITAQASNFTPAGTLVANASDAAGVLAKNVAVTPVAGGKYVFTVDTVPSLTAGHYKGNLTLKLCSDAACNQAQVVPSVSVPYDITVLSPNSAWPGDKLTALTPWAGVPDWNTFQGNAAHTGYVPVDLNPDKFSLRWKRTPTTSSNNYFNDYGATLVAANGIFYAAADNLLKARKEFDGSTVWTYDVSALSHPSTNPPAVADGVVYMAAGQQQSTYMFAFDAATGTVRFKSPMSSQWENYLAPVAVGDAVYTNSGTYGGLQAISATGERMFTGALSQTSMWSPSVDATSVIAYVGDSLTVFDRKTGAITSKIVDTLHKNYVYKVEGAAVLGAPGTAYAAHYANAAINGGRLGNSLMRFELAKGYIDWRIDGNYPATPAYASGILYAPNNSPYRVEARAETDGALRWTWTPQGAGETGWAAEPIITKTHLFVSTSTTTYAIDLASKKAVWSYPAAGKLALSQSGILYIQNAGALVAINLK
jgi:hypothetical protein